MCNYEIICNTKNLTEEEWLLFRKRGLEGVMSVSLQDAIHIAVYLSYGMISEGKTGWRLKTVI